MLLAPQWILDTASGHWGPVSRPSGDPPENTRGEGGLIRVSPDGEGVLFVRRGEFSFGRAEGPRGAWVPIPQWVRPDPSDHAASETLDEGFYLSSGEVFFQQSLVHYADTLTVRAACHVFDLASGQWSPSRSCVTDGDTLLRGAYLGPAGACAFEETTPGFGSLLVWMTYDGRAFAERRGPPTLHGTTLRIGSVQFSPDGTRAYVLTPCTLDEDGAMHCDEGAPGPFRSYEVSMGGGPIRLLREHLPPFTALDAAARRYAWPQGDSLCVGDPGSAETSCFPVPGEAP